MLTAEFIEKALEKLKRDQTPDGIAAVFMAEADEPGFDGAKWLFAVSDGNRIEALETYLAGSQGGVRGMVVQTETLEAAVEQRMTFIRFDARESRVGAVVAAGPISLRKKDLRPHPKPPAGFL